MRNFAVVVPIGLIFAALAACIGKGEEKAKLPDPPKEATVAPSTNGSDAPTEVAAGVTPPVATSVSPGAAEGAAASAVVEPPKAAVGLRFTGQVTAVRASKLAFRIVGFVDQVIAKPGQTAKKGDVLATLDDFDFKLKVALAQARAEQAKVALEAAKKELERERQLKSDNASTATVFDQKQTAFDTARLQLKLAELDVSQAERNENDTKLRAPYDCIVSMQLKFEGENLQAGNAVFEVVDMGEPEITFDVPELMLGKIKVGDQLDVTVPSGGFSGKAEVVRMVPVIAEKTRTFRVITRLGATRDGVVPGSYAEAKLN